MRESPSNETQTRGAAIAGCRRVAKRWLRRGQEARGRLALRWERALAGRSGGLRVAAAATGEFPLYFHTFVYQELLGLHEQMGADVKVFYLLEGDRTAVEATFGYLLQRSSPLPNAREVSLRDLNYFRRTAGGRVASLFAALARSSGMSAVELERDDAVLRAFSFARQVQAYGADYIHTYFFYAESLFGLVAQWLLGLPRGMTAYTDHMLDDWRLKLVPLHLETADLVVATSQRARDELVARGGAEHAGKIIVKPNGVDGRRFPFCGHERAVTEPLEVVSVSRLEPKKGLLELVDVARSLRQRGVSARFHVVGTVDPGRPETRDYERALRAKIEHEGLSDVFELHGAKTHAEMLPLFRRAHVFVAPYREVEGGDKDGIPTAILEAMSVGLPVVATDAGAIPEVLTDGVEGRLLAENATGEMAAALAQLAGDPAVAAGMGARAHARFAAEFDAEVTDRALHARLRDLLEAN